MAGILLIHGAWHGTWCWDDFASRLSDRGQVPPPGTSAVARLAARHPLAFVKVNLLLSLRPFISTPALVRELFFTADTPQVLVDRCEAHLQDESYPAFIELATLALPRPCTVEAPVLVLGAERDGIFTVGEVHRIARAYRTEAEIFPGMGHDMMLDQGWQDVADRVDAWVRATPRRQRTSRSGCDRQRT